ncbi:MAG: beta-glucosidase family protein, partial [Stackebrandtia sp.]
MSDHHNDNAAAAVEAAVATKLAALTLADKVRLLTGSGSWTLHPLPDAGLRPLALGDGPAGVRGVTDSPEETGASFPSPSALAATWDLDLAERLGALFAAEARSHNVDVVLAPVANLQRTPVGGRHFECFSEDPTLSGALSATLVKAMQERGVGACAKHFVANDSETARTEYIARIDPRTLREVYLAPFEAMVRDAGVWTVMAAYNGLDDGVEAGAATEHRRLLHDLLKEEWGFDGVVMSDWTAANSTAASANAGLDLVMPGPGGPWEDALLKAVQRGEVPEEDIDDKVGRILRLAHRVGAFAESPTPTPAEDAPTLLRHVAARACTVVKDDARQLPLDPRQTKWVALIGHNAVDAFFQGGGSAHVNPEHVITPEQGLRAALPSGAVVSVRRGGYAPPHLPTLDLGLQAVDPVDETPGLRIDYLDASGVTLRSWHEFGWRGWLRDVPDDVAVARVSTRIRLHEPGTHYLGVGTVGVHRILVDGQVVAVGDKTAADDVVLDSSVNAPPSQDHPVEVEIDSPRDVYLVAELQIVESHGWGRFVRAVLRHAVPGPSVDDEIAAAEAAARKADVAVVVVGTSNEIESEGFDRVSLALPGRQDELVRRVQQTNPNTIVVVNAGAPVLLPWLDEVSTVVWSWFPGQECGHALADVLFGKTEPSGRLPWTLPARAEDVPTPHAIPVEGVVDYEEGIHIGYRSYLKHGVAPAAPFGHGLGWTDWDYLSAAVVDDGEQVLVDVAVRNTGPRRGSEVVQVYAEFSGDGPERPVRWLAGFGVVEADPGDETTARIRVDARRLQIWDADAHGWITPPGRYD